ncbi:MAG: tyrosine-type recombinase/integrase [Oscillospiraceae bacterium]|nr:tyrosine-type recombinase/integrase [Oscillospiraceae bacterium]
MAIRAEKTKSGKWRCRVYDYTDGAGKKHYKSFTAKTRTDAELLAADFIKARKTRKQALDVGTVGALVDEYIRLMEPTLSPSTITGYRKTRRTAFPELMECQVSKLTPARIQRAINAEVSRPSRRGAAPSPKTIKNEWGVVSAALAELAGIRFSPKLPTYQVAPKDLPEAADVMAAVRGSDVELPVLLALCLGLTMSEIRGLKCSDVDSGTLTIRRTLIDTDDGPVVKPTGKTATRLRRLVLAPFIEQLIHLSSTYSEWLKNGSDGFLEPRHRSIIYRHFRKCMDEAGIVMTFHNLRALNASVMLAQGVPDKYAMERGGWATPTVMKRHYQQTLDLERRQVDAAINDHFAKMYDSADDSAHA